MPKVRVTAVNAPGPKGTRCRAGMKFGPTPVEVEVDTKQLAALKSDPILRVEEVEDKKTDTGGKK